MGINRKDASEALKTFQGVKRRFELKGRINNISVFDDYAHHPTEIKATLKAAKNKLSGRIWCIFQPHTYHRTKSLWNDFLNSFENTDKLIICDIYMPSGRETESSDININSMHLVDSIKNVDALYIGSLDETANYLLANIKPGDNIITMGAGSITTLSEKILKLIEEKFGE